MLTSLEKSAYLPVDDYVPAATATAISVGFVFNGFNNQFGPALSCIITSALVAALIGRRAPPAALWREIAPVFGFVVLATLWASGLFTPSDQPSFTPDLLEGAILGIVAGMLALVAGYIVARNYGSGDLLTWLLLFGGITLLLGLYLRQDGPGGIWTIWTATTSARRFAGTLGNANVAAVYAGVLAVLALAKVLATQDRPPEVGGERRRKLLMFFYWLIALLAFGTLMLSASRTTTIVSIAGALALVVRNLRNSRRRGSRALVIVWTLGLIGLGIAFFQFAPLEQRFTSIDDAFRIRQIMWGHYADIALASPRHGYGLGSFSSVNTYFLNDPALAQLLWSVNSAHDIALQLVIEGGIPYLALIALAGLWIAASVARSFARRRFSTEEVGMIIALGVIFASACVDIVLDVPAMVTLTLFLTGLLWGRDTGSSRISVIPPELAPAHEKPLVRG